MIKAHSSRSCLSEAQKYVDEGSSQHCGGGTTEGNDDHQARSAVVASTRKEFDLDCAQSVNKRQRYDDCDGVAACNAISLTLKDLQQNTSA